MYNNVCLRFVSKNMALSSDDDLNGLTQGKFRANYEFDESESNILRDIFQTESLLVISVEEQSFLSENTSECSVVEGQCSLKAASGKRAVSLVTDEKLEPRKDGRIPTNTKLSTNWVIEVFHAPTLVRRRCF